LTAEWRASRKSVRAEPVEARECPSTSSGRTAGAETGAQLLERILKERRARWEAKQLAKFQEQGKTPPKDWKTKYPEPVKPDTTNLPELPEGWVWASIEQCSLDESSITDGPFGSNLKTEHYQATGPRVIRLQNIGDGVFNNAEAHISESHYEKLVKHKVEENDLVIAMLGEILPRACIVPAGISPAIVKADCARVTLNTTLLKPDILNAHMNSKPTRDRISGLIKGIGRPRINISTLREIPVALCPIDEQEIICNLLSEAYQIISQQLAAIEFSLKQSTAQRQNILKAAFSGQLVPQDPNDEPASVLLERIRAERDKQLKPRKGRSAKDAA
jgi:type I restriction enzyme S subunit